MDNTTQYTSVDKVNELFEYEMTDVILKLKGEVSAVSGETVSKIADNVPFPRTIDEISPATIESKGISVDYPEIKVINTETGTINRDIGTVELKANADDRAIEIPETSVSVQFEQSELELKPVGAEISSNLINYDLFKVANIEKIDFEKKETDTVQAPETIVPFSLPDLKSEKINSSVPNTVVNTAYNKPDISLKKPGLSMPDIVDISLSDVKTVNIKASSLTYADVSLFKEQNPVEQIKTVKYALKLPQFKEISGLDSKDIKVNKRDYDIPEISIDIPDAKKYFTKIAVGK